MAVASRLTEDEKTAICKRTETDPVDIEVCKKELDLNYDYQIAVHEGKFSGTFNDYKKSLGLGVVTWSSKNESSSGKELTKKNKKVVIGVGLSLLAILLAAYAYKKLKR